MSMLQKAAQTLPLWIGKPSETIPSLCGAVCAAPDYIAKPGRMLCYLYLSKKCYQSSRAVKCSLNLVSLETDILSAILVFGLNWLAFPSPRNPVDHQLISPGP